METLYNDLDILAKLFSGLPGTLPDHPSNSKLCFELDADVVEEEGWGVEFNRRMEIAWESWKGPIRIQERGVRLENCIHLLREALFKLSDSDRELWVGGWTEKLKCAALAAGAQLPNNSTTCLDVSSDSSSDSNNDSDSECEVIDGPLSSRGSSVEVVISGTVARDSKPKLRQTKLSFTSVDRATYLEQCAQQTLRMRATTAAFEAAEAIRKEEQQKQQKVKDMLRKRTKRAEVVEADIQSGRRDENGKVIKNKENKPNEDVPGVDLEIEVARMRIDRNSRAKKQYERQSTQSEVVEPLKRICWQTPARWIHILAAVKAEGGMEFARRHPSSIVKRLKQTHADSGMFDGLHKGVFRRWFDTNSDGEACWSKSVLDTVEHESHTGGRGRSKKLTKYPAVVEGFTVQVQSLRTSNVPITTPVARSILLAHLRVHAPEIADEPISDRWLHLFLHQQLGFSYRAATKSARKRPTDWENQCLLAFLRISRTLIRYNIKSPRLVVNADQTGILLFPVGNKTWELRGSKQVKSICHDEKRQYTLVVASSCGGDILPFQSVWGGTTDASLPSADAARRKEADELGFQFAHGDTRHWSSLHTTKEWVVGTLVPYLDRVREEENLPPNAKAILYIDCWPVNISKSTPESFLPWMAKHYPDIEVLFCPAGCTGEFQPADTMLQRIVKHVIKQAALDFFAGWATRLLKNGAKPEQVVLPNDLPTLRNASVAWTLEAYHYLAKRPDIVKKSWEMCRTGDWNLSWSKLTCPEATELFFATVASNPKFMAEVSVAEPLIPCSAPEFLPKESDQAAVEYLEALADDLTLSADELVRALIEGVGDGVVVDEMGVLQRSGDEDDIEVTGGNTVTPSEHNIQYASAGASSSFLTDIAVLGRTNPAAVQDLSATRKGKMATLKATSEPKKRKREANTKNNSVGDGTLTQEPAGGSARRVKRSRQAARSAE
ncbi:hypothetical protein FRC07_006863 [Ceratobasidium sp. 392]|nr:hypothetical protein FRC07_006863 [Ceratobasidium sp. 392]